LLGYSGDGRLYHQNFAKAEFRPEDAGRVSFVELLNIPTIGRSDLELKDLDPRHLDELNELILCGTRRNVFLSNKVVRLMRRYAPFRRWLRTPIANQILPVLHKEDATTVYQHLHFSKLRDLPRAHDQGGRGESLPWRQRGRKAQSPAHSQKLSCLGTRRPPVLLVAICPVGSSRIRCQRAASLGRSWPESRRGLRRLFRHGRLH
jgi:hypothetical protein